MHRVLQQYLNANQVALSVAGGTVLWRSGVTVCSMHTRIVYETIQLNGCLVIFIRKTSFSWNWMRWKHCGKKIKGIKLTIKEQRLQKADRVNNEHCLFNHFAQLVFFISSYNTSFRYCTGSGINTVEYGIISKAPALNTSVISVLHLILRKFPQNTKGRKNEFSPK